MMKGGFLGETEIEDGHRQDHDIAELIFSWSPYDILNQDLYKYQVEDIPLTFQSVEHHFLSFVYPLLEEIRAELASSMEIIHRAPFAQIWKFRKAESGTRLYDVTVGDWSGKEPYKTLPGDLFILTDGRPKSVSDLQRVGRAWALAENSMGNHLKVNHFKDNDFKDNHFMVKASENIEYQERMFVVFLMNITTQTRIWDSLHMNKNMEMIKEVIAAKAAVNEKCGICARSDPFTRSFAQEHLLKLNESQRAAIVASVNKAECSHKYSVEQIWGPPGTGKTTTVSVMLFLLLQMNHRILACAPTNVAIVQLASRVLNLVRQSFQIRTESGVSFCPVGDVLMFGNMERSKVYTGVEDIYLENRIEMLTECLGSLTGWKDCIGSMIDLLEDCVSQYNVFLENELFKEEQADTCDKKQKKGTKKVKAIPFLDCLRDRFKSTAPPLIRCIITLCSHIPRSFIREHNFQSMVSVLNNLSSFESLLFQENLVSEKLQNVFASKPQEDDDDPKFGGMSCSTVITQLKDLQKALEGLHLPSVLKPADRSAIKKFCFEKASLIFCTASNSYKLHTIRRTPLNLLVIDEAAQLKEAESTISLQLQGIKHVILIGDEFQLPAVVKSNVSKGSCFGRSLFERLSSLGYSKHLLDVQYRMHPSISSFPNWKFYQTRILDAENVTSNTYVKQYLPGPMFGPYAFINVEGGKEEKDDYGQSLRNMVEVAIVIKIVQNLYRACHDSKEKLSIGVVSPYAAQVSTIQEKLFHKFNKLVGFSVKVKSVDGFQGGEEDVIILSTVRCNERGSVGFVSSSQRMNVALTRARHCLWILGNERTLVKSESAWRELVCDARNRHCFFDAVADSILKMTIISVKMELEQLDDLVNENSVLFKHSKWKVLISDDFRKSFGNLGSSRMKKMVLDLLLKLSGGWRPKSANVDLYFENSCQILKKFKVEGLYVICTIDIVKESRYIQVLKVWDLLHLEEIPKLTKRLESLFASYTDDYISHCTTKCLEGNLEVPKSWEPSLDIIRLRTPCNLEDDSEVTSNAGDGRSYVENSKPLDGLLGSEVPTPVGPSVPQAPVAPAKQGFCLKGHFFPSLHGPPTIYNNKPRRNMVSVDPQKSIQAQNLTQQEMVRNKFLPFQKAAEFLPSHAKKVSRRPTRNGGSVVAMENKVASPPEQPLRYIHAYVAPPRDVNEFQVIRSNHGVYETNHTSDNDGMNGKDVDEYLRELNPDFNFLLDTEVADSEYYPNEEQFRTSDFDLARPVDYAADQHMYPEHHYYDHYNKEEYAREDRRESYNFGRKRYTRDDSPDQFDQSDLRHRLSKKRRLNDVGGLRSVVSREHPQDIHADRFPRRDANYDHRRYSEPCSLLSRLRGRITIPVTSILPRKLNERKLDRGRQHRSRYSPRRTSYASSNHCRLRDRINSRANDDIDNERRNYRGSRGSDNDSKFTGPRRLSEDKSQSLGKRKYPRGESQQPEVSKSFEGPKPLSEILKRKRGSIISLVNNEDNNSNEYKDNYVDEVKKEPMDGHSSLNNAASEVEIKVESIDEDAVAGKTITRKKVRNIMKKKCIVRCI